MLNTIVGIICWTWAIEVAAGLLMYAWAVCQRSHRQARTWPGANGQSMHHIAMRRMHEQA